MNFASVFLEGFDAHLGKTYERLSVRFHVGLPLVPVSGLVLLANLPGKLSEATQGGNDTRNTDFNAPQIKAV